MKKYFDDQFLSLLEMPSDAKYIRFLHHTNKAEIAQKIIEEGFRYYDSFYKTTDEIIIDEVYLNYWFQLRRPYGNYAVVIIIAEQVVHDINDLINSIGSRLTDNFNVLGETLPVEYDDDYLFTLSHHFVRGYYDMITHKIEFNPEFNPHFYSHFFEKNIQFLNNNQ